MLMEPSKGRKRVAERLFGSVLTSMAAEQAM
jgi:hypothetical protein